MRWARRSLVGLGMVLIAIGAREALTSLGFGQLVGLAVWLAGAIVAHDGIIVPGTTVLSRLFGHAGAALSPGARAVSRIGFVVGGVLTLIALAGVLARNAGTSNPTVLVGDYAVRLLWTWAVVIAMTALGVAVAQTISYRATLRHGDVDEQPAVDAA